MRPARDLLQDIYLEYVNNYLTVEFYAEYNGLTVDHARTLIDLARSVSQSAHPEA